MKNNIENHEKKSFEDIKHIDKSGNEFWYARELAKVLEYSDFRNFTKVINKAIDACLTSDISVTDHVVEVNEMVKIGSGAEREMSSYTLSRYACYLIVQNGDPSKPVIAQGQTYFAIQTRRQELQDNEAFNQLKEHNKQLVDTAYKAGVETNLDFAIFQNHGYKGLYGGLDAKAIHDKKGLKKSHKILDYMGSTELAANLFRATQAEEKLKRDDVHDKERANDTHFEVGKKVRSTIEELGGTMPEELPTPDKSVKKIEKEQNRID